MTSWLVGFCCFQSLGIRDTGCLHQDITQGRRATMMGTFDLTPLVRWIRLMVLCTLPPTSMDQRVEWRISLRLQLLVSCDPVDCVYYGTALTKFQDLE